MLVQHIEAEIHRLKAVEPSTERISMEILSLFTKRHTLTTEYLARGKSLKASMELNLRDPSIQQVPSKMHQVNNEEKLCCFGYSPEEIKTLVDTDDLFKYLLIHNCDSADKTRTLEIFWRVP
ncbi:hypothetical protein JTE90_011023 [Oedothorax gibbosus]|uniref:Uncharacterized protein n=1 Tax=Oedothorax gibbosus TaxID=931172 RepID=A0AAV6VCM6_9ARAC|nr:hypothetical protein JTE90_011023 [Oedothorax gibbosus]